jgi:ribosomal protein S12 methylthiotransferase
MPLQHASKNVLRAMHRSGDSRVVPGLIESHPLGCPMWSCARPSSPAFPERRALTPLSCSVSSGWPPSTTSGVFVYSAEEGTPAAEMPDQVPMRTRRARAQRLRDIADVIGFEKVAEKVGRELDVLVEGVDEDEGVVVGRWRGQAPEIDGLVLLDSGAPGEIRMARIVDSLGYDLEGEVTR